MGAEISLIPDVDGTGSDSLLDSFDLPFWKNFPHSSKDTLVAQLVRNLPAMQEALFRFLGREVPQEKG